MKLSTTDEPYVSESDTLVVARGCRFPEGSGISDNIYRDHNKSVLPQSIPVAKVSHLSVKAEL